MKQGRQAKGQSPLRPPLWAPRLGSLTCLRQEGFENRTVLRALGLSSPQVIVSKVPAAMMSGGNQATTPSRRNNGTRRSRMLVMASDMIRFASTESVTG